MAKTPETQRDMRSTALATSPASPGLPATDVDYGSYIGAGYEGVQRGDFAVPFLTIVQGMSAKILAKVEAARPGMIINSTNNELYNGAAGVEIIGCYTDHRYVRRKAQKAGGAFVESYSLRDPIVRQVKDGAVEFGKFFFDYNNQEFSDKLVETYYLYGLQVLPDVLRPVVITFKSKGIPIFRGWLQATAGNMVRDPRTRRMVTGPLFSTSYRWKVVKDIGQGQEFYNWAFDKGRQIIPTEPAFPEAIAVWNAAKLGSAFADESADPNDEIPF